MDTVLLYATGGRQRNLLAALKAYEVRPAGSPAELSRLLIGEPEILCLILESQTQLPDGFLDSLKACFPVLPLFQVSAGASAGELAGLSARLAALHRSERRGRPRFDWPLRGSLSLPGEQPQDYDLRALSSSGAYLSRPGPCPPAGSRGRLRVLFRNFRLETECQVLDTRRASSKLPDGFGVRFLSLSAEGQALLDRIVRDALVQALLEPDNEPPLPSLDDEELLPGGFQLL